ncbi:MAG TPA: GDSL-type esterase/lipase family protein [Verrucomicrobiae bacterium]|nr:GDSL-type esterase/lipase family protein [Verrucomicrobiae bacterium]
MNRIAHRLVLLALIVPTLLQAADTNHNFAVWEPEVRAYEAQDRTSPPPANAVLFVGSSGIRLWKTLAQDFPDTPAINRGVGGCEIVDCTYYADRIIFPYKPKKIVMRCGGNDLANGKSPETVFADFKEFVRLVRQRLPRVEIVFISWNPTIARWNNAAREKKFNNLVKEWAHQIDGVRYVETYDMVLGTDGQPRPELFVADKLHFSAEGYRLLTERVRPAVQ